MLRTTRLTLGADGRLCHRIPPAELSNDLAGWIADDLVAPGLIPPSAFERTFVSVVGGAWLPFYRNTLRELTHGGAPGGTNAGMAPVHDRAAELARGSVVELGCCFGFLSLRMARDGHRVTAVDLSPGTVALLASIAPALGTPLHALVGDAAAVPLADRSADTVFAVHLLEHLPPASPRWSARCCGWRGGGWWWPCRSRARRTRPGGTSARSTSPTWPRSARPPAVHTPWTTITAAGS